MNGEETGSESIDWFVEADHAKAGTRASQRARFDDDRANSVGMVIITSLFIVLFGAALLVGGRAAFAPLLRNVMAARDAKDVGDVVYSMPDGAYCRHMSFNNDTGEVVEGAIMPCPNPISRSTLSASRFEWGTH